ncbi:hypothetical protein [Mesorhizobium sp. STM 4661]|uniref:hypothetical protein n=1 Tax=Mesorhizobium sp. STM 4661 TaxID=1297570 RepID=UPI0012F8E1DD|nr:hypothetical protein [Mesorhizobium sp. STM 4661]
MSNNAERRDVGIPIDEYNVDLPYLVTHFQLIIKPDGDKGLEGDDQRTGRSAERRKVHRLLARLRDWAHLLQRGWL